MSLLQTPSDDHGADDRASDDRRVDTSGLDAGGADASGADADGGSRATGLAPVRTRRPAFHPLTVSSVDRLTSTSVAVTFAVPSELSEQFAFEPGQHLTLRATIDGDDVRRSYSICMSRPEALRRKEIRVGSAVVDGGRMSTWLNNEVAVGDVIQVMSPLGTFTRPERDATSVAEGEAVDDEVGNKVGDDGNAAGDLTRNSPDVHDGAVDDSVAVGDSTAHDDRVPDDNSTAHDDSVAVGNSTAHDHSMALYTAAQGTADRVGAGRARHHVAVAAGSGITPVLSIAASILQEHPDERVTLIYGNRRTDSVMFLEELEDLKNAHPSRFHLMLVLSREMQDVELFNGRIDAEKLAALTDSLVAVEDVDDWYLCGPFGLVEDARIFLSDKGVERSRIHHEIFHVDEPAATEAGSPAGAGAGTDALADVLAGARSRVSTSTDDGGSGGVGGSVDSVGQMPNVDGSTGAAVVTVNLDGRTTRIDMADRTETILAATLRERPDAPYSCTGGVCGTCRARVVTGEVTMDRCYALEPEEIAAGLVLACQAHPVTDEVALDYDA
ncbi:2Fe-2S iron-sulfur cluster-binding protein [Rudaeicoccus suwonensis]|uniref:Flavin-dependent oxidoreductase n=1 Tax=Rudaeicoccus suwonensis TaxID=657409 RepID=A0A561ECN7_9MICO|nr:flavin-dependent oxidoreductase [Rudaeicoccus suwonensis]